MKSDRLFASCFAAQSINDFSFLLTRRLILSFLVCVAMSSPRLNCYDGLYAAVYARYKSLCIQCQHILKIYRFTKNGAIVFFKQIFGKGIALKKYQVKHRKKSQMLNITMILLICFFIGVTIFSFLLHGGPMDSVKKLAQDGVHFRLSSKAKSIVEAAGDQSHQTLSEFARAAVLSRAVAVLANSSAPRSEDGAS